MSSTGAALLLIGCFIVLATIEIAARRGAVTSPRDTAGRAVTNFGLGIIAMIGNGLPLLSRLGASVVAGDHGIGFAHRLSLGWPATFTITLLLQSLVAYWLHRLMHAAPWLWRIHRVHHADEHLDISTGLRNHPLELLIVAPASAAVILLIGAPVSVVIAVDTILFAAALWQHADFVLPSWLERRLRPIFVTPAMHRAHHLPDRRRHDANYGDFILVWDRLFGTLHAAPRRDEPVGLDHQRARPDHLIDQLCAPFERASRQPAAKS